MMFRVIGFLKLVTRHLAKRGGWWLLGLTTLATLLWASYFISTGMVIDGPGEADRPVPLFIALLHGLFASLQFIVLNKDLPQTLSLSPTGAADWLTWGLYAMLLLMPLVAAFSAISALFGEQILAAMLRRGISRYKDHCVIFGVGGIGKAIAKTMQERNLPVAAVDRQGDDRLEDFIGDQAGNHFLPMVLAMELGANGDEQRRLLQELGCNRANRIVLALPDQNVNLRLLHDLQQCSTKSVIHVRTSSESLYRLFSDWIGMDVCKGLDVRPFNPYHIVARGIVNLYAPDLYVQTDRDGDISNTIMIVGASELAVALLLRFARVGIYSPHGRLKILWVGKGTAQAFTHVVQQYPALAPNPSPCIWQTDLTDIEASQQKLIHSPEIELVDDNPVEYIAGNKIEPAAIYVCLKDEIDGLLIARDIQAMLGGRNMPQEHKQRLILVATSGELAQLRTTTGLTSLTDKDVIDFTRYKIEQLAIDKFFAETLLDDKADNIAKRYKAVYDKTTEIDQDAWRNLSYFEKESNRDVADHLAIKARYAGLCAEKVKEIIFEGRTDLAITQNEEECFKNCESDLIDMEQRRYQAFMFLMGFRHGSCESECKFDTADEWKNWDKNAKKGLERILRINSTLPVSPARQTSGDPQVRKLSDSRDSDIFSVSLKVLKNTVHYTSEHTSERHR